MALIFGVLLVGIAGLFLGRALAGLQSGAVTFSVPFYRLTATRAHDPRAFPLAVAGNVLKALVALGTAGWLVFFPH